MMKIQTVLLALPIALLMGCAGSTAVRYDSHPHYEHSDVHYRSGPPPYAPAHGYRHHYHNHDMIYDSGIRAYIIVGLADYYYDNGYYFRYSNQRWQSSGRLDGGWNVTDEHRVPQRLWNTRAKKHYYDNDQRGQAHNYKSDKERYRNGHENHRGNSDKEQSKHDYKNNKDRDHDGYRDGGHRDRQGNDDH